jgi:ribonuclease E
MEDHRHQANVERRLKEAMKSDRARIQIGRISAFGLLELSRQRLRPSIAEISFEVCPHCQGTGRIRSTESTALHVLRGIEEEIAKARNTAEIVVHVPTLVALYLFNHKRAALADIETRHGVRVSFQADETLIPPAYKVERVRAKHAGDSGHGQAPIRQVDDFTPSEASPRGEDGREALDALGGSGGERDHGSREQAPREHPRDGDGGDGDNRRGGRRRRRGRGRDRERPPHGEAAAAAQGGEPVALQSPAQADGGEQAAPVDLVPGGTDAHRPPRERPPQGGEGAEGADGEFRRGRRRRGRRGGRRRREGGFEDGAQAAHANGAPETAAPEAPAQPFAPPAQESFAPVPYRVAGPGDDLDRLGYASAPPPPRVEGPGDSHDWPWNRCVDAPAPAVTVASTAAEPPPAPIVAEAKTAEPAPAVAAPPPPEDDPNKPKRKGWWNRLTG